MGHASMGQLVAGEIASAVTIVTDCRHSRQIRRDRLLDLPIPIHRSIPNP